MTEANESVDLAAIGQELLTEAGGGDGSGARAARTVLHENGLRATVIALRAGHELAEHEAPPAATLFVHSGQVQLRAGDDNRTLAAGSLTAIPQQRHSLLADSDAVVLLTVRFE